MTLDTLHVSELVVMDAGDYGIRVGFRNPHVCNLDHKAAEKIMRFIADKLGYIVVDPHVETEEN